MINVGFLGAGEVAGIHGTALASIAGARLAAVADSKPDRARALAGKYGAVSFPDLEAMLSFQGLDVIYILTPPAGHASQILAVAEARLPIVCEKPLTVTLAEADQALDACRLAGVPLMTGLSHRYHPLAVRARQLLLAGELGDFVAAWSHRLTHLPISRDSWLNDIRVGGGLILQYAMHDLDWLCWLGGDVIQVSAQEAHTNPELAIEDNRWALLQFRNGGSGIVGASWSVPLANIERGLVGSQGNLRIIEQKRLLGRLADGRELIEDLGEDYEWFDVFVRESRDIVDRLRQGQPFSVTGEDGRNALELALSVQRAAQTGRMVLLPLANESSLEKIE
jgi:UDP-N-acetyl-2-amino-2-deoxyglucuronate dehydrogenase